jgi:hypothetical protein
LIPTLSKLFSLSLRDVLVLVRAWCLFVYVDWVVSRWAYERWPAWMKVDGVAGHAPVSAAEYGDTETTAAQAEERAVAKRVVQLAEIAGRYNVSQMNCLRRCLVQRALLRRSGIFAKLELGVRKEGQSIAAHSWLTLHQQVLNDSEDVTRRYAQFDSAADRALQQLSA